MTYASSLCAALVLLAQSSALAQAPAATGTIVGVVRDSAGTPIASAEVALGADGARTLTAANGTFRFENLAEADYTVTARRIGYYPQSRAVRITNWRGVAEFALVPVARMLPTVVTSVSRGGVSGIVEDMARIPVRNALVSVLAANRRATTDSTGSFFIDVRPGKYVLQISRDSFATRLVSVTVPRDSGRRVHVGLRRASTRGSAREAVARFELRRRLMMSTGPMRLFTREDLDRLATEHVDRLASFAVVRPVDRSCFAVIDGDAGRMLPLWVMDLSDVELLEIYPGSRRSRGSREPPNPRVIGREDCPTIIAWLRK